jgi:hypothetical protein
LLQELEDNNSSDSSSVSHLFSQLDLPVLTVVVSFTDAKEIFDRKPTQETCRDTQADPPVPLAKPVKPVKPGAKGR